MLSRKLREEELRKIVSSVRQGDFLYQKKEDKEIDFVKYNKAQINEISDVLEMIRDVVNTASKRLQKTMIARGLDSHLYPLTTL